MRVLAFAAVLVVAAATENYYRLPSPYTYNCKNSLCHKVERFQATSQYQSRAACQLTCGQYGALWPQPTGDTQLSEQVVHFNPYNMRVKKIAASNQKVADMLDESTRYFTRNIHFMHPNFPKQFKSPYTQEMQATFQDRARQQSRYSQYNRRQQENQFSSSFDSFSRREQQQSQNEFTPFEQETFEEWERYSPFRTQEYNAGVERQNLNLEITVTSPEERLSIQNTDESYNLVVQTVDDETTITILADTYYGARHAMESLSQLISYDENNEALMIVQNAKINDQPQYKYRALMLDTGRNYYTPEEIMSLLDSMSQNKMNVFHWHITDAASFPFYSNRVPQMAYYGSYGPNKVYYPNDIRRVVEYARLRGISVIPELTGPAHTSAGWQWGEREGKGNLALCTQYFNNQQQPWFQYGKEAPSGQLNPVNPEVYNILQEIYTDMMDYFDPEMVHMGGDGVSFKCWQNSEDITEYLKANGREASSREYFELWNTYQSNAFSKLREASKGRQVTPIIHSSSFARNYIDKETYIIQLDENANETSIADYVNNGFKVIFATPDQWRLDCDGTTWYGEKAANCPLEVPTWKHFYDITNSPLEMLNNLGVENARLDLPINRPTYNVQQQQGQQQFAQKNPKELVLGGVASMWSPETDGNSIETKVWPRVSAMAERLWSDPIAHQQHSVDTTQKRINIQRFRMVERGIRADPLQPELCFQDESACYSKEEYQLRNIAITP